MCESECDDGLGRREEEEGEPSGEGGSGMEEGSGLRSVLSGDRSSNWENISIGADAAGALWTGGDGGVGWSVASPSYRSRYASEKDLLLCFLLISQITSSRIDTAA